MLAVAAGVWQRERLWVWYCAERLERASDDKPGRVGRQAGGRRRAGVPTLLALLRHDEPGVCAAAEGRARTR